MTDIRSNSYTCFDGDRRIATGTLQAVAKVVKESIEQSASASILIFDNSTGRLVDIDIQDSDEHLAPEHGLDSSLEADSTLGRGRGRPKLGVVPREVTLLPRHWEWLATQPGGASVTLRKLVEEARRANRDKDRIRKAQECAYAFIAAMAGNLTDFEEASRALFANDPIRFKEYTTTWPDDVRDHAILLAFGDDTTVSPQES